MTTKQQINKEYYQKNKEKILLNNKIYSTNNYEIIKIKKKEYAKKASERIKAYKKEYYIKNLELLKIKRKVYRKGRREKDDLYKMQCNLRKRIWYAFKLIGKKKSTNTTNLLGIELEVVKKHIENKFEKWMNWENYGNYGWVIDHIIPLASAKTIDELASLCHYTNLQPLSHSENASKRDAIIEVQTRLPL